MARSIVVSRAGERPRRSLRGDRGDIEEVIGRAQGSSIDMHVNAIRRGAGAGPYHLHTNADNFYFVLEGRARLRIDGTDYEVGPGDSAFVGRGIPHSVSVDGEQSARLIEIYAPADPDFVILDEQPGGPR